MPSEREHDIDIDIDIDIDQLYRASTTPSIVDVPEMTFLMIDGHGDPNTSPDYQNAIEALYALSYSLTFAIKRAGGVNHKMSPLEGLWWAADWTAFATMDKSSWEWTAMIRQPDDVTAELHRRIAENVMAKKQLPPITQVRLERFAEGRAGQILHVGPYADEGPTITILHEFLAKQGYHFDATRHKHHEIYLGDPRRAAPEKLRTIIRQPVARTAPAAPGTP
jgi:hypothetical protein